MLRKHIKKHANQQKHGELNKHDGAAGKQRAATVTLALGSEEALHDGLVRAVSSHGEKGAADDSGPKRVFRCQAP